MADTLFHHFLVVRLRASPPHDGDKNTVAPVLRARVSSKQHGDDQIPSDVLKFCFPDAGDLHHGNRMVSEAYTFVLTSSAARWTFGFCRRHLHDTRGPDGKPLRQLECLCLLTAHPYFSMFKQIMEHIQIRWKLEPKAVLPLLKAVLSSPVPEPGRHLLIELPISVQGSVRERFAFIRRRHGHMAMCTTPLLNALSGDNLLVLISALLCERRVIFSSKRLSVFSGCVHAAVSLLFPFRWQHMFIPVLSMTMLHLVCAPMPFIVGVRDRDLSKLMKLPLEPVLIVQLDDDKLQTFGGPVDLIPFPASASRLRSRLATISPKSGSTLRKGITTIMGKSTDVDRVLLSDGLYHSFLAYFLILFGNWMRYIDRDRHDTFHFNFERFLEDSRMRSPGDFAFFQTIRQSQLFESFIRARIDDVGSNSPSTFTALCSGLDFNSELAYSTVLDFVRREMSDPGSGKYARIALEATSMNRQSIEEDVLQRLAKSTFISAGLEETLDTVWTRFSECSGRQWRHASLALRLLLHLLVQGSDAVLARVRDHFSALVSLTNFSHKEQEISQEIRHLTDAVIQKALDFRTQKASRAPRYSELASIKPYVLRQDESAESTARSVVVQQEIAESNAALEKALHKLYTRRRQREQCRVLSPEVLSLIDDSNRTWAKYRTRSLIQGRAPILPKFSRLHRKMRPSDSCLALNRRIPCRQQKQCRFDDTASSEEHLLHFAPPPATPLKTRSLDMFEVPSESLVEYQATQTPDNQQRPFQMTRAAGTKLALDRKTSPLDAIVQQFDPFLNRSVTTAAASKDVPVVRVDTLSQDFDPLLDFSNLPKINRIQAPSLPESH